MAERGATLEEIAGALGFCDRAAASRAVAKIRTENAMFSGPTVEIRQRQLDELAQLRRVMWGRVMDPPPLTDRVGRVVHDDAGGVVPDIAAQAAAGAVILRAVQQEARLCGTEMPKRSVHLSGKSDTSAILAFLDTLLPGDLEAALAERRRQLEEPGPRPVLGEVEE